MKQSKYENSVNSFTIQNIIFYISQLPNHNPSIKINLVLIIL